MLSHQYKIKYNPPIFLIYVVILLISFTFTLTFFEYTNFLKFNSDTDSNKINPHSDHTTQNQNKADKSKHENDKEEKQLKISKEDSKGENSNDEIEEPNEEHFFSNGRTFDHLYSKSLKSPFYEKEFPKLEADVEKMEAVKEAFMHAWTNYDKYCFGHDAYRPQSHKCTDGNLQGGLTLIDSISTIIVMGLEEPYKKVREYVKTTFAPKGSWSLFEFNIRYLGGLLSAYSLSHDEVFKDVSVGLGDAVNEILGQTDGFFPRSFQLTTVNRKNRVFEARSHGRNSVLADSGTYQLEFLKLSEITGDDKFIKSAMGVYKSLWKRNPDRGLLSTHIGAGCDSYYEYVIKSYLMTGGVGKEMLHRHLMLMENIKSELVFKSANRGLVGIGRAGRKGQPKPDVEHLATFAAGMIALGAVKGNDKADEDLKLASDLATTYAETYAEFKSGIMPEHVEFNTRSTNEKRDIFLTVDGYILRPETVESIFYLYRFTGDKKFRDFNWRIFKAINSSCRVKDGFTSISYIKNPPEKVEHVDEMESFFLAETLKYLYLTFADSSLISPVEWVFNTEAHPLHMWDQKTIQKFRDLVDKQIDVALKRPEIKEVGKKSGRKNKIKRSESK